MASSATQSDGFETYVSNDKKLTFLVGDFFTMHPIGVAGGQFQRIWDRAALVAVEPALRDKYVAHLDALLAPGARLLLDVFDKAAGDPVAMAHGPPYSVPEA